MLDFNSDEETNMKANQENIILFYETDTYFQNDIHIVGQREQPRSKSRDKVRVELVTPNNNLLKNHPID